MFSPPPGTVPLHRLVQSSSGHHFYTISDAERDSNISNFGWISEGDACFVYNFQPPATSPFHRLNNSQAGDHLYTTSDAERDQAAGYVSDGEACWVFTSPVSNTNPFHRLYSPNLVPDVTASTDFGGIHVCVSHRLAQKLSTAEGISALIVGLGSTFPGITGWIMGGIGVYTGVNALILQGFDKGQGVCLFLPWIALAVAGPTSWIPSSR